jgi:hypothetical protein
MALAIDLQGLDRHHDTSARLDPRAILPLVQAERAIRRACPAIQEQLADEMREDYSRPILGE